MRFGQVAPVFLGIFIALACGSTDGESKVGDGTAATGNNNAGSGNSFNPGSGSTTGNPGGGAASVDPGSACTSTSADGEPTQVDLFFMVDITGSMNCPVPDGGEACVMSNEPPATGESRWTVVSAALKAFVADPKNQGLGVGMRFFPEEGKGMCNASEYATPDVAIGPLSMTAQPLTTAINRQRPNGYTPTVPSLTGAIEYAKKWAAAHPTHRVAVVFATDGQPNGCGVTSPAQQMAAVQEAATVALQGAMATPNSIPTYVLGVGPDLDNLNSIAKAGGTQTAFLVSTSGDAAAQLSAALASIRSTTALDCTYTVPQPPAGATLNPDLVNVEYTNGAGVVTKVGSATDPVTKANLDCATANGWQYSSDKKQINLCGKTCSDVKADKGGKVQVLFGCTTQIGEPPT